MVGFASIFKYFNQWTRYQQLANGFRQMQHSSNRQSIKQPINCIDPTVPVFQILSTAALQQRRRQVRTTCLGTSPMTRSWWHWSREATRQQRQSCHWHQPCAQWRVRGASLKWSWLTTAYVPKSRFRNSTKRNNVANSLCFWTKIPTTFEVSHPDRLVQMALNKLWRTGIWFPQTSMCTATSQRNWGRMWTRRIVEAPNSEPALQAALATFHAAAIAMLCGKLLCHLCLCVLGCWYVSKENLFLLAVISVCKHGQSMSKPWTKVQIGEEVPAIIKPMKPKFYLLGEVVLESGIAVKLK